jgi:arabinosaccharide transport system permease protein
VKSLIQSQKLAPYVFIAPFIITFILFQAYPVFSSILMSFQEILPGQETFVGLKNYRALDNSHFYAAVSNSLKYTFWTLVVLIPLPLVLAVLLNSKLSAFRNVFRSALFIPSLTSIVVGGAIFRLVFGELPGAPMNSLLSLVGFEPVNWMGGAATGMFLMVTLATWRWLGINIVYFLSGLQSIPQELYEAADIDGAGPMQKFLRITVPLLKPVTVYVLTISIYGGLAMFTESYVFWGVNSPNDIALTIVGYLYKEGLVFFNLGFGAAIGITLLVGVLVINLIQLALSGQFRRED